MARAGYADVVTDSFGNRIAGASIEVRQPGTQTKVTGSLYAGPTGAATLSNPFLANSLGYFAFYREVPETVDLYVTAPGYAALTVSGVALAADAPVLDGSQLVAGSVTATQIAAANQDGAAGVPSLRTLGTGAQQAAAGNHGHTHGSLSGIGANDHHAQVHALSGADHSGTLALAQQPVVPQALVYHAATQSVPHNSATYLTFSGERYDTDNLHDAANPTVLTCRTAGLYLVWANVGFAANAAGVRLLDVVLNGTFQVGQVVANAVASLETVLYVATVVRLGVDDSVQVRAFQNSGGSLDVAPLGLFAPTFGLAWLSP